MRRATDLLDSMWLRSSSRACSRRGRISARSHLRFGEAVSGQQAKIEDVAPDLLVDRGGETPSLQRFHRDWRERGRPSSLSDFRPDKLLNAKPPANLPGSRRIEEKDESFSPRNRLEAASNSSISHRFPLFRSRAVLREERVGSKSDTLLVCESPSGKRCASARRLPTCLIPMRLGPGSPRPACTKRVPQRARRAGMARGAIRYT
jgi:hypothetical protein